MFRPCCPACCKEFRSGLHKFSFAICAATGSGVSSDEKAMKMVKMFSFLNVSVSFEGQGGLVDFAFFAILPLQC